MTTPPGPDGVPPWLSSPPSPEFLAAFQAEMRRRAAEASGPGQEMPTPLDIACLSAHTVFEAAVKAGFSERNAIIFAVELLTKGM
jgi:hypothetical protein